MTVVDDVLAEVVQTLRRIEQRLQWALATSKSEQPSEVSSTGGGARLPISELRAETLEPPPEADALGLEDDWIEDPADAATLPEVDAAGRPTR